MIKFLFTSYPVATETFLQRELIALQELGLKFEVESLWGGKACVVPFRGNIYKFWKRIWTLPFYLIYWGVVAPRKLEKVIEAHYDKSPPNLTNFAEGLLGLLFGLTEAARIRREGVDQLHGVWASAPTTAAWFISQLTGIPYSFSGHAYDLFEDGGDWTLESKIANAQFMRSSTNKGCAEFMRYGVTTDKVHLIRRGLNQLPAFKPRQSPKFPFRILSVGRLVEKMGYLEQLDIYADLKRRGLAFEARILGDGPLKKKISTRIDQLGLRNCVFLEGAVAYSEVEKALVWSDCFLFTGKKAKSGDQAGLPNAVAEAMAWGRPVFAFSVGAIDEVIENGITGRLIDDKNGADEIEAFISRNEEFNGQVVSRARKWVESNYVALENMKSFKDILVSVNPVTCCGIDT